MPIEAKISLMNKTEKGLSSQVTADDMNTMLRILADTLQEYDVFEIGEQPEDQIDLVQSYVDALTVEGRSPNTIAKYKYNIGRLLRDLKVPIRQITVYHIRSWLKKEQDRGIAAGTLNGDRDDFSAFFGWLHREGLIERNPMSNIGSIKGQKKKRTIYSPVDIEKLNDKCADQRYTIRNKAIMAFLRSTGCRISEMTGLNRDAVNLNSLEVVVLGKGNKERKVYLDEVAGMLLQEYLEVRTDDNPALFIGAKKNRFTPGGVRAMLRDLADLANVEHVHPHKFRRTLGTNLSRRGMPVQEIAHILGHEKLDTTMRYIALNDDEVKNDYRKFTL